MPKFMKNGEEQIRSKSIGTKQVIGPLTRGGIFKLTFDVYNIAEPMFKAIYGVPFNYVLTTMKRLHDGTVYLMEYRRQDMVEQDEIRSFYQ